MSDTTTASRRAALVALLTAAALTACGGATDEDRAAGEGDRPASSSSSTGASGQTPHASRTPTTSATHRPSPAPSSPVPARPTPSASAKGGSTRSAGWWRPKPGLDWQWQLNGRADQSVDVPVYDIDGFENSAADVARLHRAGRKAICYINVGAWEDFRSDKAAFPASVLGSGDDWDGERWLDVRQIAVLKPLMAKRFDMCRAKGFDAVEPDLVEAYNNDSGFDITAADQLAYNRMIAKLAHERGMAVGLKNDLPQVPALLKDFDFAVNEECAQYDECDELTPFVEAGKAVFHVEYEVPASDFCADSRRLGLSSMEKKLELGVWRKAC
ncbi:endo alpha-1,4 polygalactosaminidase [Streptomyces sp. NBC_00102]|uniref:endo alpha-1,4 polygalactosaminidase n=1 Tax=Streptomyces sp. NBC_00102 TaxID=2975652 RepID=UPI00224D935E|nr:endo alpha-1,4 polygalactosaminidase [Streptomyces sp. NBC_00102]MCX5401220.1 endo alpha-1,4 polygalactosaminidase [Streptomyces sp. NBC_00102]